jgi:hypothetical protein
MLQRRQIVKALEKQIDVEDPDGINYASTSFHSIAWMFISVKVTIYRTNTPPKSCQSSHCITTAKLRSSI